MNNVQALLLSGGFFFIFIIFAISIGIAVLYLLTLQNVMKAVTPENQLVPPTNVWLMLIPLFNLIYPFILYPKIADSIKQDLAARGVDDSSDCGRSLGITMPILGLVGMVPVIGGLAGLANLIIWIIFWSKMSTYKTTLLNAPKAGEGSVTLNKDSDLLDS